MNTKNKLKKLFIPHEDNGYKPDFLERFSMGIMLVLILISFAIANLQALLWIGSDFLVSAVLPSVIAELTNEERADESVAALKRNALLDRAAKLKAEDMANKGYFAHYSPEGISPWYWFDEVSYNYIKAGENLAVHFSDSGRVVDAWMDSPSHRANIMNDEYTEIGIGTAKGEYKGSPTVFVVQLFGTPNATVVQTSTVVSNVEMSGTSSTQQLASGNETDVDILGEEIKEVVAIADVQDEETETESEDTVDDVPSPPVQSEDVEDVVENDDVTTLYSDTATTSREVAPIVTSVDGGTPPLTNSGQTTFSAFIESITQPSVWLQLVYAALAFVVVVSLVISIVVEWRRQHPIQIAYAGGLIAVMAVLFHIHTTLTSGVTII